MPTVILAENDLEQAQVYIKSLQTVGFNIIHVTNAEGIERTLTEQEVDIIVSDTNLDNSYGDEICSKLLQEGKLEKILIIGMSNALDYGDYWINVAHHFIHKKSLDNFYNLGQLVLQLYKTLKINPKTLRYKENPLIDRFTYS